VGHLGDRFKKKAQLLARDFDRTPQRTRMGHGKNATGTHQTRKSPEARNAPHRVERSDPRSGQKKERGWDPYPRPYCSKDTRRPRPVPHVPVETPLVKQNGKDGRTSLTRNGNAE